MIVQYLTHYVEDLVSDGITEGTEIKANVEHAEGSGEQKDVIRYKKPCGRRKT